MIFMRVDLPAPFSPTRPWTCPTCTSKDTPSSATTPGKRLVMSCMLMKGGEAVASVTSASAGLAIGALVMGLPGVFGMGLSNRGR